MPDDFRVEHFFDVIRQLDEAAQVHVRRLSRDYLHSPRLSKSEERRLWGMCYNYWGEVGSLYARCLERAQKNPKDGKALALLLLLLATRLAAARATQLKWVEYRYGPVGEDLWRGLGQPYLAAEAAGYAQKPVALYPGQPGMSSVAQQYLQALVFSSASMDSLLPNEIELAGTADCAFPVGLRLFGRLFAQQRLLGRRGEWRSAAAAGATARQPVAEPAFFRRARRRTP